MEQDEDEYLTIEEVAKKLKVAPGTIYRMVNDGRVPATKIGRVWRISSQRLAEMFNNKPHNN